MSLKDSQTEEILHRIIVVPKQVQQAALKQFTKQFAIILPNASPCANRSTSS